MEETNIAKQKPAGLEVLGDEFEAKYREHLQKKRERLRKLDMTPEIKKEIIGVVKANITPEMPKAVYNAVIDGDNRIYDIVLVETPEDQIPVREVQFGSRTAQSVKFDWNGKKMSTLGLDHKQIAKLEPGTPYILVGRYSEKPQTSGRWAGMTFINFTIHAVLSMEDLAGQSSQEAPVSEEAQAGPNDPASADVTPEPQV